MVESVVAFSVAIVLPGVCVNTFWKDWDVELVDRPAEPEEVTNVTPVVVPDVNP